MNNAVDVLVLGGGPGGYTAALYAARAGLSVLVLERLSAGGQMATTGTVENYPGFEDGVDGFELGEKMQRQAQRFGARTVLAEVREVALTESPKRVETDRGTFLGRTVVVATGAEARELAVGDALTLARLAGRVTLIHRRDALRASAVYLDKLRENGVNIVWNTEVKALQGDDRLTGLVLRNKVTGEESTLPVDGLFVAVGRRPETALFRGQLETDEAGYLIADETTRTSLPGVYAVGDVRRKPVRQILTAAADGAVAAHYIEEYLAGNRA